MNGLVTHPILRGVSFCAGTGGIDLALKLLFGDRFRTYCFCEWEAGCAATLVARMADKTLDSAPVWDDMRTWPAERFRGVVNFLFGGIPCQDFSVAGQQRGDAGERDLWPVFLEHVRVIEPEWFFIENVPGMLTAPGGIGRIYADATRVGYRVEAGIFSAEEVGASHKRERLFILAHRNGAGFSFERGELSEVGEAQSGSDLDGGGSGAVAHHSALQREAIERSESDGVLQPLAHRPRGGLGELRESPGGNGQLDGSEYVMADPGSGQFQESGRGAQGGSGVGSASAIVADTSSERRQQESRSAPLDESTHEGWPANADHQFAGVKQSVVNAEEPGLQERFGRECANELPPFPPGPTDADAWARVLEIDPTLEPAICGVADGTADGLGFSRPDQLRMLGNGVVPLTVALAFVTLLRRFL